MPFFENPVKYGNLYLSFIIVFPKSMDKNQIEEMTKVTFLFNKLITL